MTTRILIADDQALVRGGLRMILDAQPDLEVVGEAADGREALQQARELSPDLVLMDVRMPELDGLEATRRLLDRDPSPKVIVLTTFDLDDYVYEAIRAGASGFLLKSAPPQQLVAGIRTVMAGDALLAPEITRRLLDRFVARPPRPAGIPPDFADLSRARARGPAPDRRRPLQRRDRRRPLPQRGDRQDPCHPHPHQAPAARPRPGRRARLPHRAHGQRSMSNRAAPPLDGFRAVATRATSSARRPSAHHAGRARARSNAAAAASATVASCSPSPPLTPTAPTTWPSRLSGMPPAKITTRPLLDSWMP